MTDKNPEAPTQRRLAWLVAVLMALPVALVLGRYGTMRLDRHRAEALAQRELSLPQPRPEAYGVLGTIRMEQGRLAEALPLLEKAAELERAGGGTRDTLSLAKARLDALDRGLPGVDADQVAAALRQAETVGDLGPPGLRAQTRFSAGLFWGRLGRRDLGLADLRLAVALQPDDWVDQGGGRRQKSPGLSAYYQRMLAAAEQD